MIDDEPKIAQIFNEYFVNIVKKLGISTEEQTTFSETKQLSEAEMAIIKDIHREKAPQNYSSANGKYEYEHLGCWYIKLTLFKRFRKWKKIFQKNKSYW